MKMLVFVLFCLALPSNLLAMGEEELAKKLANPVADLISFPSQLNYDQDFGAMDDGDRWLLNMQPVIPFHLNENWNLVSRTIIPLIYQDGVIPGTGSQSGISDILQSFFFSPKAVTASGWIWGAGPALLFPTGSDDLLTTKKWGAGPTVAALTQRGPWTFGGMMNHIWSYAGDDDRAEVNQSYFQPYFAYITPSAWTFMFNTESTYDWENEQWSVPVNAEVKKMTRIGNQMVNFATGIRYWIDSPDSGPEGFGFRFAVTFLFPK